MDARDSSVQSAKMEEQDLDVRLDDSPEQAAEALVNFLFWPEEEPSACDEEGEASSIVGFKDFSVNQCGVELIGPSCSMMPLGSLENVELNLSSSFFCLDRIAWLSENGSVEEEHKNEDFAGLKSSCLYTNSSRRFRETYLLAFDRDAFNFTCEEWEDTRFRIGGRKTDSGSRT